MKYFWACGSTSLPSLNRMTRVFFFVPSRYRKLILQVKKLGMWINGNILLFFFETNVGPFWQLLESAKGYFVNITANLKLSRNY